MCLWKVETVDKTIHNGFPPFNSDSNVLYLLLPFFQRFFGWLGIIALNLHVLLFLTKFYLSSSLAFSTKPSLFPIHNQGLTISGIDIDSCSRAFSLFPFYCEFLFFFCYYFFLSLFPLPLSVLRA